MTDWLEGLKQEQSDQQAALKKSRDEVAEFYLKISSEIAQVFRDALGFVQNSAGIYRGADYTLELPYEPLMDEGLYRWSIRNEYGSSWMWMEFGPGVNRHALWLVSFTDNYMEHGASVAPRDFSTDWLKGHIQSAIRSKMR